MIEFEHIHHVSLAVRDLAAARSFYTDQLQLQEIERPPFRSRGIWYAIGNQQLHLLEHPQGETLRTKDVDTTDGHFAIWVRSYNETIQWLDQQGIPYEARPDSVAGFAQIFLLDPDRNIIEFGAPYSS
ncbi:VOC family protein [Paenibacillus sp. JX-17]|uniref:VOC family protein n=1 Tax=Paenibacillus lacisoli TaxID=3064525 RepID=A0ABT9CJ32_9BACL|nr:VOC family protein [Paenibacillus sp. JX-17]MDO7907947.1 VOC family protein [Paenibacillus sp. JX-17]